MAVSLVGASIPLALGQETGFDCFDPMNMMPLSTPYLVNIIGNDLMVCAIGVGGTATYGGPSGPCFNPAVTVQNQGHFAFSYGPTGSIQQTQPNGGLNDSNLPLVFGARSTPSWTYAATSEDGTRTRFGANALGTTFVGFSNRYQRTESTNGNVFARLQAEVVADAVRLRWTLTNLDAANAHSIGLFFGGAVTIDPVNREAAHFNILGSRPGYVFVDKNRPPITDVAYDRNLSPVNFPEYVDFVWGQSEYFGFRIENSPSASTDDIEINRPTTANRFWIGKNTMLLGALGDTAANFPLGQLPDTGFLGSTAFVQEFSEISVQPGGSRTVLHYIRSTWGKADYKLPFGVVVDAPTTIGLPQFAQGDLFQNPFPVRVYVDNVGGFGFDGKEFELNDVRVRLEFPANAGVTITGAPASSPHTLERTIQTVAPREDEFLNFQATLDENVTGVVPYKVIIEAQPGFVRKEINGTINVAARPRLEIAKDANMLTLPYTFQDTSLETIFAPWLDPNVPGGDMQFYRYDAGQQGYVITNTAERGTAFWVIYDKTGDSAVISNYAGSPTQSSLNNAQQLNLRPGFNMIGNPHNYQIPINQINGVSAGANQISRTFQEMVDLGYVQSFLSYWDPELKDYVFVPASEGVMMPHQGYWINVLTADNLSINYPPVFLPFVPDVSRNNTRGTAAPVTQTENDWSLKITGRTRSSVDSDNAIGIARNRTEVNRRQVGEPPMAPVQDLSIAVQQNVNGKDQLMARAYTDKNTRNEWTVKVTSKKAGDVTISWPNLSQIPKNVRLTLVDGAANIRRQVRQTSGYTFRMEKPGTRELTIVSEPGGNPAPVIGNVIATRGGGDNKSPNNPFTIAYTLGSDATTTVRILSAKGQEVYVVTRGRADRAGENTVTWNLRNSANQAVAPGTYRVEIIAESDTGERVRRTVAINVIR